MILSRFNLGQLWAILKFVANLTWRLSGVPSWIRHCNCNATNWLENVKYNVTVGKLAYKLTYYRCLDITEHIYLSVDVKEMWNSTVRTMGAALYSNPLKDDWKY